MPGIHEKTHFKSATTLGFMLPSALYTLKDAENEWHPKKKKDLETYTEPNTPKLSRRGKE